jgi:hypothetical protein
LSSIYLKSNTWHYEEFWRSIFSFGKESCNDEGRIGKTHCMVLRRPKFLFEKIGGEKA